MTRAPHYEAIILGSFVDPGSQGDRSPEYDTLVDRYARFLVDEVLPDVGKTYNLTKDPEGRAIARFSSGAICAFTVTSRRNDRQTETPCPPSCEHGARGRPVRPFECKK